MQTNLFSSLRPLLRTVVDKTKGRKPKPIPLAVKRSQLAEHVMPRFTRVTKLSFVYAKSVSEDSEGSYDVEASLIFPQLLSIVGNRLQALRIQSPFVLYLPPRLESLETFSLDACKPYHTSEIHKVMIEKVPAFLLAQKSTIRSVSFMIDNPTFDVSPILQCLQFVSCLHDIRLALPYVIVAGTRTIPGMPFKQGCKILEAHRQHLRSLDLSFTPNRLIDSFSDRPAFRQECWSVDLPNLRKLTIYIPGVIMVVTDSVLAPNLKGPLSSSLVSLTIQHQVFSVVCSLQSCEIRTFCKMLGNFPCLQDLSFCIYDFDIRALFIFADALPRLRSLFVDYCYVLLDKVSFFFCKAGSLEKCSFLSNSI